MTQLPPDQTPNQPPLGGNADNGASTPEAAGAPVPPAQPAYEQPAFEQPAAYQDPAYGQPAFGQPGYPQQGYPVGAPMPQGPPPTNVFAIVGFVAVFFSGIAGVILGHIALNKIKRSGESGRGFALAATIIGYVRIGLSVLGTILFFVLMGIFGAAAQTSGWSSDHGSEYYNGDSSETEGYSGEWDPEFSDMPWVGTENEAVCTALLTPDVSIFDDASTYYRDLLRASDDAELNTLLEELIGYADGSDVSSDEAAEKRSQAELKWSEASSEMASVCMGER